MHGHIKLHTNIHVHNNHLIGQLHVCAEVDKLMTFILSDFQC